MSFGAPFALWVLPLCLLALALLWAWSSRHTNLVMRRAFNTPLLAGLLGSVAPGRRWFKRVLIALGLAALLVALARPQWGRNEVEVERTGVDLVIALDVSRSMLAADAAQTNRLHVARTAIQRLLDAMGGDRAGLVAFAGEAFMIAPLTRDHVAVDRALRQAIPAMISEQGSNLAEAINKAGESFERGATGPRALLVVSDGEQLQGDAVAAARKAYRQGIRIHTAGVGSALGARVPAERASAFVRNAMGREVVSRRDEQKLQQVASAGGGGYTRIEESDSKALVEWFQRTAATLPRTTEKQVLNEPREQFQWPLAIALLFLAMEWMINDRKRSRRDTAPRPAIQSCRTWLLLGLLLCADRIVFAAPDPWQAYNDGVNAYAKADYTNALQRWQELSIRRIPRGLQRPVWFQLGNVHFRLGEPLEQPAPEQAIELWTRSCEAYRSALAVKPRDSDVLHNLAFVERRLARLMHRLGAEAFHAAENKSLDEAINLLRNSTDFHQRAANLDPTNALLRAGYDQARRAFRERLKTRAEKSESKGDDLAKQTNPWTEQQAEDEYRSALEDVGEARKPQADTRPTGANRQPPAEALDQSLAQAQQRVEEKLSQLLTRRGQREQKQGDAQADARPDQALEHYEFALEHYRAAQEALASNQEAQRGEREVRDAMEKLHVREGKAELKRGKEALAQQNPRSAQALSEAVSQFEAALQLNANNEDARAGADEARRLLPEALNLAGRAELTAGDRSEPRSLSDALAHYQEAEKDFRQSLELRPNQPPAEQGLKEAEEKLARTRKRAEQEAESVAKASQPQNQPPRDLQSLLGQVTEKQRAPELDRERQRAVRNYGKRGARDDW